MKIFKFKGSQINNIISRSFILSSVITLVIALIGSIYFNNSGLQIIRQNNLKRQQELLSNFLIPAIIIADTMEVRRLLSLASDINEKFVVIDNSENALMPDYDDLDLVKSSFQTKNTVSNCNVVRTGHRLIRNHKYWINCTPLTSNEIGKKQVVGILISFSQYSSLWFSPLVFYFFGIALISLLLNAIWFRRVLNKRLLTPLTTLGARLIQIAGSPFSSNIHLEGIKHLPHEINEIKNAFQSVLIHLQTEYSQRIDSEKKSALLDQAARVAHDIRSPIAAMEMSLHLLSQDISKEKISMMQLAIQSVRGIANNLLNQYRNNHQTNNLSTISQISLYDDVDVPHPILLYSVVEQIISQKRYEWLRQSCELTFEYRPETKTVWINAIPGEVKRIISNLLNNAIEACTTDPKVNVHLNKVNRFLTLQISDNGVGIPDDKIYRFLCGESSKHAGIGIGLSSAIKYMENINGELSLKSQEKVGTTITLTFIKEYHPIWYPKQINLSENDNIIILDDDSSMQSLWFHRFQIYPVKIHLFSNYGDVHNWIKQHFDYLDRMVFIVDYELSGQSENGLMLLNAFNIKHRGYLITSHAENLSIQNEVEKMGIWLIPKTLAGEISVVLKH